MKHKRTKAEAHPSPEAESFEHADVREPDRPNAGWCRHCRVRLIDRPFRLCRGCYAVPLLRMKYRRGT